MRGRRRLLSLVLAFSMIMSLFAGQILVEDKVSAADSDTIVLNSISKSADGTYYTYPGAEVQIGDASKKFHNLTITVDSGHMRVDSATISGITGQGIVAGTDMNSSFEDISTDNKYEAVSFEFEDGVAKSEIENYIRQIRFTTSNTLQTVYMCASTKSSKELTTEVGGQTIELKYFNGHYYGFVLNKSWQKTKWSEAYEESKTASFQGVNGYMLTITSRAEDRFILSSFPTNAGSDYAMMGWMGCTRAVLADGSSYSDPVTLWNPLAKFTGENLSDFQWHWVSGPETGQTFGYQNDAFGYTGGPDGGFVTKVGCFSNWNASGNIEPNGGVNTNEAYGFYGKYKYGRWNDNEGDNPQDQIAGYYIEFGGNAGDDEKFESELDQIIVSTQDTTPEIITDGTYTEDKVADLTGKPAIIPSNRDGKAGTILTADISGVGPQEALGTLKYQWYTVEGNTETPISGATDMVYKMTAEDEGKTFVVKVVGPDAYPGTLTSDKLIPIQDVVSIVNNSKDKNSNDIVKEGSVLTADVSGVNPSGSHDTLTYQWYIKDGDTETPIDGAVYKNYTLTSEEIGKDIVVKVTGNGNYYNTLSSTPYDAERTDAGIKVEDPTTDPANDKLTITVDPTMEDYVYTLQKADGTLVDPVTEMKVVNGNGDALTPDEEGYYEQPAGGVIKFTELDKDNTYVIVKKKKSTAEEGTGGVVGPSVSDVTTEYDDKDTEDKSDDTISIIVDPALEDSVYAIRKKVDGTYVDIPVVKDENGNWVPDEDGTAVWTSGNENKVTFSELPADGTYKVVAKSSDGTISDVTPGDIIGGSKDIVGEQPAKDDGQTDPGQNPGSGSTPNADPNTNPGSQPTASPSANTVFTKAEEDAAAKFVKEHATDPKGKIVTKITDMTRDIIVSGESDWKKLTANEKAAVNAKLKAGGSKYTYEQLLKMAKKYKVPGFKVIKFMQKKSKAKLKLIKCKGATIVCTSTNSKVATVNKKGVISAKKPGRATLTFTAIKGKYTNRLVIDVRVKKKFKNAKELTKFKSNVIKTPTVLVAKKRLLKKSSKIQVYDLEKSSKVKFTPINKKILTINKKGKYTGKKKGSTLVKVTINQNKKVYLLYVYVTIY